MPEEDDDDEASFAPTRVRPSLRNNVDTEPSIPGVARDSLLNNEVSGFHVEGLLGRGAAGIVYQATQLSSGRKVAFKVLKPEFAEAPEYIRRLIEEAKALSALRHRGIIDIIDFGALPNGQPYLVMELCEGLSLEDQLRLGGKPTLRETLGLLDELLSALGVAHDHGIVHRDVKPSNLFLATHADGSRSIKVLDFGLARMSEGGTARPTLPGAIIGTPDYMAPEQIIGKEVGSFSDIYATGTLAFRLLTDRLPFIGRTGVAVISMKMEGPPPHARDVLPTVPPELDALVFQMMSPEPQRRPSIREARARFAAYLKSLDRGPTPSLDDSASQRPTTFHRFDDQIPARLSPPSRPTEVQSRVVPMPVPPTELEEAFVPPVNHKKLRLFGLMLFAVGIGCAIGLWFSR